MSAEPPARILIVDDSPDVVRAMQIALGPRGYDFTIAENGRVGLATAFAESPDLILLDLHMPELDGFQVLAQLKANVLTSNIPVVMLTADGDPQMVVRALEAGADDFVRKPFYTKELDARVRATLQRTRRLVATDPLTKLPGNVMLRDELERRLEGDQPFSICYLDLDNFKAYVDAYGFQSASRVIQEFARNCYNQMVEHGGPSDFIGHIGGDDFVIITSPDLVAPVCEAVIADFEARRGEFYKPSDREQGFLRSLDRDGNVRDFPLMTITIAVLNPRHLGTIELADLAEQAARAKHAVKALPGSNWRILEGDQTASPG